MTERYSAAEIARRVGEPPPTPQQARVIEAPLEPVLVIAGAGSGKTSTMAARVLWLVANELVAPGEILGLTFTRKAAGELGARISEQLAKLREQGLMPGGEFEAPTVSTYNSYANALYRDNAIVLGREGDGTVLGEAAAWQLARSVVRDSAHPGLLELGEGLEKVTRAVLELAHQLAEHTADPDAVAAFARRFAGIADLPLGDRYERAPIAAMAAEVAQLEMLVDLAVEFDAAKARRGFVEYSDQVALGLRIIEADPRVAQTQREQFRVMLLDEYQDTSVGQTRLLSGIFGGHPVMAVGDPNQSIYGWRGASASNLEDFGSAFGAQHRFSLSVSWRNGERILDVANQLVKPLGNAGRVDRLQSRPGAGTRPVEVRFEETLAEEAAAVAAWLRDRLAEPVIVPGKPPRQATAALLLRARRTQPAFLEALREAGVPVHVLGLGGLLAEPEVADLVSALQVLHDPGAGSALLRLLTGSRWRIGLADIAALREVARWLERRNWAQQELDEQLWEQLRASVAPGDGGSIVDALDFVATAKPGHRALSGFSELGRQRLREAGRLFARLRTRGALELPELVAVVMQELQLDIEVAANEHRTAGTANLDALFDALQAYLAVDDGAGLGGFLAWLREAEQREDLRPRPEPAEPGTVQVLTMHGSKGLEWDHVAVPRLVNDELPGKPKEGSSAWLGFGRLPWPFRGDAEQLPVFEWEQETRKEVDAARKRFGEAVSAHHEREERRLSYVAVTRARDGLLLSGSFWASQSKPRPPSAFLTELAQAELIRELPAESIFEQNPAGDAVETVRWPFDPLGGRRHAVQRAADAVRNAEPRLSGPWAAELELLLAERRRALAGGRRVALPRRVAASGFKDYLADPAAVAAGLLRPMPQRPFRATRLGTLFHAWVEQRSAFGGEAEELDALAHELDLDDTVDAERFEQLKAAFEASPWGSLAPAEVEREIHLPFDGGIVVCKIDAVYELPGGRFEIVDWKTGAAPRDAADLQQRQLQLALYRLAYARWKGIDPGLVDAVFYFVRDDAVVRPERLLDEEELLARWREAVG